MPAAAEYCPTCWCSNGVQNLLKRISINFDDAIIVCTNSECDYMRIPSADEFAPEQISSSDAGSSVVSMGDDLAQLLDQLFASSPIPSPSTAVAAAALPCTDSGIEMELLSVSSAASLERGACRSGLGALSSPPAPQMSLPRDAARSGSAASESRGSRRTRRRPDFYDESATASVRRRRSDVSSQRGATARSVSTLSDDRQDGMAGLRLASLGNCHQAPPLLPRKLPPRKRLHKGGPPQSSKLCSVRVDGYGSSVGVDSEGNALQRILAGKYVGSMWQNRQISRQMIRGYLSARIWPYCSLQHLMFAYERRRRRPLKGSEALALTTACSSVSTTATPTYSQVPGTSSHNSAISYMYKGPVSATMELPGSSTAAGTEVCPNSPLNVTPDPSWPSDGSFTGASSGSTGMMNSCSASCLASAGVSSSCSFVSSDSAQVRLRASTPLARVTPQSWQRPRSTASSVSASSESTLLRVPSTATTLRRSSLTEQAEERWTEQDAPSSLAEVDTRKWAQSNVGSRLSRGLKRRTAAGQLCQPLSVTDVASTRPLFKTAVASTPPLSETAVASTPPLSETAVAFTPPLSEAAVASTPPMSDILRLDTVFIRSRQVERVKAWARCRAARSRSTMFPVERPRL